MRVLEIGARTVFTGRALEIAVFKAYNGTERIPKARRVGGGAGQFLPFSPAPATFKESELG